MSEEMRKYIERTNIPQKTANAYGMTYSEVQALHVMPEFDALHLAFQYGMAKGYRAGRACERQSRQSLKGTQEERRKEK